jgi:hypothetical protein
LPAIRNWKAILLPCAITARGTVSIDVPLPHLNRENPHAPDSRAALRLVRHACPGGCRAGADFLLHRTIKGTRVCGDFLPPVCQGRAYEERDGKGFVAKQVEAPLTPEQLAKREAENARKAEEAKKAAEERRRNLALLATYSSEKDILSARDRALAEVEKNQKQAQLRLDEANKKKKKIDRRPRVLQGQALARRRQGVRSATTRRKSPRRPPPWQPRSRRPNEVRARFEDERKKYLELTGKKPGQDAGMGGMGTAAAACQARRRPGSRCSGSQAAAPAPAAKPAEKK